MVIGTLAFVLAVIILGLVAFLIGGGVIWATGETVDFAGNFVARPEPIELDL